MLYLLLKWLHVLAAIVALGANLTYGIWIAHASRHPEALSFTLRSIKLIDDRVANPAYGLLLVTGLLMVFVVRLPADDTMAAHGRSLIHTRSAGRLVGIYPNLATSDPVPRE